MRPTICILSLLLTAQAALASVNTDPEELPADSLEPIQLEEISVFAKTPLLREANELWHVPGGVTMITPKVMREFQLRNLTDLTALVPGLYIPDYGSSYNAPIYYRGIGARSGSPATTLYIDGVPTLTQSVKRDLIDLASIRVMSASHSSTYGRNSMAGNIHIRTVSPFDTEGLELLLRGSSAPGGRLQGIYRTLLSPEWGLSAGGFVDYLDGYFTNTFDGKKIDRSLSGGGTIRTEWRRGPHALTLSLNADAVRQGAFPYAPKDSTGKVADPNINRPGSYRRFANQDRLLYSRRGEEVDFHLATGVEYLDAEMKMDQDYSPVDVFSITQREKQCAGTLDLILKSALKSRLHWVAGLSGHYLRSDHNSPVEIYPDGLRRLVQPQLDRVMAMMTAKGVHMPGKLLADTETATNANQSLETDFGVAGYFEASIADFLLPHLTLTTGLRVDLEHQRFDYDSDFISGVIMSMKMGPKEINARQTIGARVQGNGAQTFLVVLPKLALSYDFSENLNAFVTISRGYKTGGYNDQVMTQTAMMAAFKGMIPSDGGKPGGRPAKIDPDNLPVVPTDPKAAAYDPEYAINYEVGFRSRLLDDRLLLSATLFDSRITNQQITRFVSTSAGRYVDNAGRSRSTGVEVSADWQLLPTLRLSASYGRADSKFEVWHTSETAADGSKKEVDLAGHYVPYMPQNTISGLLAYHKNLQRGAIKAVHASLEYRGVGPVYRDPANTVREEFYSLLGARAGLQLGPVDLTLWGRNLLNTEYHPFHFAFLGEDYFQKGAPLTFGLDLEMRL